MISNCGHDENGRYNGGKAGDQTGGEWTLMAWYSRPWAVVLRHPNSAVRNMIAEMAEASARNDLIGYDQNERYTFWKNLADSNYDPKQITVPCEADCSSGVAAIAKATGIRLGIDSLSAISIYDYTGNLETDFANHGFIRLKDQKYLTSDQYLLKGDILLYPGHHTAINLTDGKLAVATEKKKVEFPTMQKRLEDLASVNPLRQGTKGNAIGMLQRGINIAMEGIDGYAAIAVDGEFGPKTEIAVKAFQDYAGLEKDGIAGPDTITALIWFFVRKE